MPFPWPDRTAIKDHLGIYEINVTPLIVDTGIHAELGTGATNTGYRDGWVFNIYCQREGVALSEPEGLIYAALQIGDNLPVVDYLRKEYGAVVPGGFGVHGSVHGEYVWIADVTGTLNDIDDDLNERIQLFWGRDTYGSGGFVGGTISDGMPVLNTVIKKMTEDSISTLGGDSIIPYPESSSLPGRAIFTFDIAISDEFDPLNKRRVGIVLPDEELVNVLVSDDDDYTNFGSVNRTIRDTTEEGFAWTFVELSGLTDTRVLAKWAPTSLFSGIDFTADPGNCTLYTPAATNLPDGFALFDDPDNDIFPRMPMPSVDGWFLVQYENGLGGKSFFLYFDTQWTVWRHIQIVTEDLTIATAILNDNTPPFIQVDQFGAWIFYWPDSGVWAYAGQAPWEDLDGGYDGVPEPEADEELYDSYPQGGPGSVLIRAWTFEMDGHRFYVLKLGEEGGTLIYDETSNFWYDWQTGDSPEGWQAWVGLNWNVVPIAGDWITGDIWNIDHGAEEDDAGRITRSCVGIISTRLYQGMPCYGVLLTGSTEVNMAGVAAVRLRTSDDNGLSWHNHGSITVESAANHGTFDIRWLGLGTIYQPGRIFEITDSGAVYRIDGMDMW